MKMRSLFGTLARRAARRLRAAAAPMPHPALQDLSGFGATRPVSGNAAIRPVSGAHFSRPAAGGCSGRPASGARWSPARIGARFGRSSEGAVSIETLFVIPFLLWAIAGSAVFYDAFHSRTQAQLAAQTVADILSRSTDNFTFSYIEGLNEVYDFVSDSRFPTRLRVSSVIWSSAEDMPVLQWSYGTRGLPPLPEETFELLAAENYEGLLQAFGSDNGVDPIVAANRAPRPDLISRIPPIMPGEAVLVVEAATSWSPFLDVGLTTVRFNQVVAVRPRFIEWIDLEGRNSTPPEPAYEIEFSNGDAPVVPDPPAPDDDITPPVNAPRTVINHGFENGSTNPGWSHTTVTQRSGGGRYLGPFGGETRDRPLTLAVDLGDGPLASARISFDLLVIDSWDGLQQDYVNEFGDTFFLGIDGTPIFWAPVNYYQDDFTRNNRTATIYHAGARYTTTMERTSSGSNLFGASANDTIWRVTVDIEAPQRRFSLGMLASLNEPVANEAFGIDNVLVVATPGTPATVDFTPDASQIIGTDPQTGYRRYSGCPDPRLPANTLTVRASDTASTISFPRNIAGINQRLDRNCGVTGASQFYASAAPHFVIDYDNQSLGGTANRLRLWTSGSTSNNCNPTLYVVGPNNQTWFHDNIANNNRNASISFSAPVSGRYHVWVGQVTQGRECNTMVNIGRY